MSTLELERKNDSNEREKLALAIQADGIRINKMADAFNAVDAKVCNINHLYEMELEKMKIKSAVEYEFISILDILEQCGTNKLPALLSEDQVNNLCGLYSTHQNCLEIKDHIRTMVECKVLNKYKTQKLVTLHLELEIPVISDDLKISKLATLPIFHDGDAWQLEIEEDIYILHDEYSLELTTDCEELDDIILCKPDMKFIPTQNYCVNGLIRNSTISHCSFKKIHGDANCYHRYLSNDGIVVSHSTILNVTKRKAEDDSRRNTLHHQHPIAPGLTFIVNSNETITSGYCNGFHFQTSKLNIFHIIILVQPTSADLRLKS